MIKAAILTLYKQHPLREYGELTEGQYSCWGDYDGMSLDAVGERKEPLIKSKDTLGLMDMWYQLSEMIGGQDGTYGQQNFGVFINEKTDGELEKFLGQKEIFQAACLIQLKNTYATSIYDRLEKKIGKEYTEERETGIRYTRVLPFRTLDNVDMIVLIRGNSYQAVMDRITDLRMMPEILYTYSICGVNFEYLINKNWKPQHPLVNDEIYQITTRIVANSSIDVAVLEQMFGGRGEWEWSFTTGNTDIVAHLVEKNQKIERAIDLVRPYDGKVMAGKSIANHQNPYYGEKIYGIVTEILAKKDSEELSAGQTKRHDDESGKKQVHWCRARIKELRGRLEDVRGQKNDMLYSYYLAMIQSLTMIALYEDSKFAKDIFYMVFPSLLIVHEQFDKVLENKDETAEGVERRELLIDNLTRHLDLVDQVIGRTIHSEQTFFVLPGCSGVLYTISLKLCLMYLAFMYAAIEVLYEGEGRYECCLYPVIKSTPTTEEIDFKLDPEDRLIELKISQRSMYCANLLPILLLHELAHYVSGAERMREKRAEHMTRVMSYLLTELILDEPEGINEKQKEYMGIIYRENHHNIQFYIQETLEEKMRDKAVSLERQKKELYFRDTMDILMDFCQDILRDSDGILRGKLQKKGTALRKKLVGKNDNFVDNTIILEELYIKIEARLGNLIYDTESDIRDAMKVCFKETYADIVALSVIGFEDNLNNLWEQYLEVFCLSAGYNITEGGIGIELINRVAAVVHVLSTVDSVAARQWEELLKQSRGRFEGQNGDFIPSLVVYANTYLNYMKNKGDVSEEDCAIAQVMPVAESIPLDNLNETWRWQIDYLGEVGELLSDKIKRKALDLGNEGKDLERIRKLYAMFNQKSSLADRKFEAFDELVAWYRDLMDKKSGEDSRCRQGTLEDTV